MNLIPFKSSFFNISDLDHEGFLIFVFNFVKERQLHIISFDHPYPPVYGGVIDVYFKVKALSLLGVGIHLHIFGKEKHTPENLSKYCEEVLYYPRKNRLASYCSKRPMIVRSRRSKKLIDRLLQDDYPIFFEGLHTTYSLFHHSFTERHIAIRMHNIEHDYYRGLAKSEKCLWRKFYYRTEAKRLEKYQDVLGKARSIFTISKEDTVFYKNRYIDKTVYLPAFHENTQVLKGAESEAFALFHGNLQVSENINAIRFLLRVFKDLDYKLLIAGRHLPTDLQKKVNLLENVTFIELIDHEVLNDLFYKTHLHVLYTAQNTGIKLKLINALYSGKHVLANDQMIVDTGLEKLCFRANTIVEFRKKILEIANIPVSDIDREKRKKALQEFDVKINAAKIIERIF